MPDDQLVNRVREYREHKGLTQAQLAERVGVSRQSINYVENGSIAPSITLALRIADALGRNVSTLFYLGDADD